MSNYRTQSDLQPLMIYSDNTGTSYKKARKSVQVLFASYNTKPNQIKAILRNRDRL